MRVRLVWVPVRACCWERRFLPFMFRGTTWCPCPQQRLGCQGEAVASWLRWAPGLGLPVNRQACCVQRWRSGYWQGGVWVGPVPASVWDWA